MSYSQILETGKQIQETDDEVARAKFVGFLIHKCIKETTLFLLSQKNPFKENSLDPIIEEFYKTMLQEKKSQEKKEVTERWIDRNSWIRSLRLEHVKTRLNVETN